MPNPLDLANLLNPDLPTGPRPRQPLDLSALLDPNTDFTNPQNYNEVMAAILKGQPPTVVDQRETLRSQIEDAGKMRQPEQRRHVSPLGTVFGGLGNLAGNLMGGFKQQDLRSQLQQNTTDLAARQGKQAEGTRLLEMLNHQRGQQEEVAKEGRVAATAIEQGRQNHIFTAGENAKGRAFDREMKGLDREAAKANKADAAATKRTEDAAKLEGSFRNDILGNQVTKDALGSVTAFKTIDTALKANTPAGDMSAVFSFMKSLDPNSSVREGEYANAQNAAAIPDQVRNYYNQAVKGTLLSPAQRQDFRGRARESAQARADAYKRFVDPYSKAIREGGGDPARVLPGIDFGALSDTVMVVPPGKTEAVPVHKSKLQDALAAGGKVIDG